MLDLTEMWTYSKDLLGTTEHNCFKHFGHEHFF